MDLLSQVIAVFTIADLLEWVVYGAVTAAAVKRILREKIYEKMLKLGASYSEQVLSLIHIFPILTRQKLSFSVCSFIQSFEFIW